MRDGSPRHNAGRSGQIRQTTTAEVCLDEGQATSFGPARRATQRFGFEQRRFARISLRRASMRRKITLENPGIWGMSDYWIDPQKRVTSVILTRFCLSPTIAPCVHTASSSASVYNALQN
jgi:hypothetical protein